LKDHSNMAEVVVVLRDQEASTADHRHGLSRGRAQPGQQFRGNGPVVDHAINRTFRADMSKTIPAYSERVFERVVAGILLKSRLIVLAKVAARRAIVGAIECAAIITPSPLRRWGKRRLTAWPRVRGVRGFGELDVTK
jgi:hypothetical protein